MPSSGVAIKSEVFDAWKEMKDKKTFKAIIFYIKDDMEIGIESTMAPSGDQEADYAALVAQLHAAAAESKCRYAAFDMHFDLEESGKRNKLVLIRWCPENAATKQKMLYSTSSGALKDKLSEGLSLELQATDDDELDYNDLLKKLRNKQVA